MTDKNLFFKAILVGQGQSSSYLARLQSDPMFRIHVHQQPTATTIDVLGPLKESATGNYEEVLAHCQSRAKVIGLEATGLAASTAAQVVYADIAERLVLASPIVLDLTCQAGLTRADLLLTVPDQGPKDARACIPQYASWRITCVAQAMGMQIQGDRVWS